MADARSVPTAVDTVQATGVALPGSVPPPVATHDFSVLGLFMQADFVVKAIMILLFMAFIWCMVLAAEKYLLMKKLRMKSRAFEKEFWGSDALDRLQEKVKKRSPHPMSVMFLAAMEEWFRSKTSGMGSPGSPQRAAVRERINQVMTVARNRELDKMENGLGFLATVGATAPFIGLFGTVWGIMNSFSSIALSNNTSLATVAPGIAEALLATAIGLFAAIPAVIVYNKFSNEINRFAGQLDDFSTEFNTILSRQIEG